MVSDVNATARDGQVDLIIRTPSSRLKLFLDNGAAFYMQKYYLDMALESAEGRFSKNVIQILQDYGTNPRVSYETNMKVLQSHGLSIENVTKHLYVQAAAEKGQENLIRALLNHGADVNVIVRHFYSALQTVTAKGLENIVQLLVDYGADANAAPSASTALIIAFSCRYESIVRMLLEHGAAANAINVSGETPLIRA